MGDVTRPDEMADRMSEMLKAKAAHLRREAELLTARADAIEEQARAIWHEGYSWRQRHPEPAGVGETTPPADNGEQP